MVSTPDRCITHVKSLFDTFGYKFMLFIVFSLHILKGFVFGKGGEGFVGVPIMFLLRSFKELNSVDIQVLRAVTMSPWALKSFFGIISDTLFIAGYGKLPYISATVIPAIICSLLIAILWPITPIMFTMLLFIIYFHMAMVDLYTEAKYSEKIRQFPKKGTALTSFVWSGIFGCDILAIILTGIIIAVLDEHDLHYIYIIPAFFLFLSIFPTFSNWIGDIHLDVNEGKKVVNALGNSFWVKLPYYKIDESKTIERNDCLLCKEDFEFKEDAQFVDILHRYIQNCQGIIANDVLAHNIYTTYFEKYEEDDDDNEDDEIFDTLYKLKGKGLLPLTHNVIKRHLDGLHVKEEEEERTMKKNVDNEPSHMILPLISFHKEKVIGGWRIFVLALLLAFITLIMTGIGIAQLNALYLCIISLVSSCVIICAFYLLVDRRIANIQSFSLIQNMFSVSIGAATFFFFTDTIEQYPEGPHFSTQFYITVIGLVSSFCGFIGTSTYNWLMSDWSYRWVFAFNNILLLLVSGLNVILYKRWNVAWGIPDSVFVLGSEAFQVVVAAWINVPSINIIAQLCPKRYEATMFAILAGSSNLGGLFAQYQGAYLLQVFGITPNGSPNESSKFENLWIASLISSVLPCIPLILVLCLIPNSKQDTHLLEEKDEEEEEEGVINV